MTATSCLRALALVRGFLDRRRPVSALVAYHSFLRGLQPEAHDDPRLASQAQATLYGIISSTEII